MTEAAPVSKPALRRHPHRSSSPTRTSASKVAFLVPVLIGLFTIYDSRAVRTQPLERPLYVVILIPAAILAARSLVDRRLKHRPLNLTAAWLIGVLLWLAVGLLQESAQTVYVLGDTALALLPLCIMLMYSARPEWLNNTQPLHVLFFLLTVAAVTAGTIGLEGKRHDPPSSLLIAGAAYFVISGRTAKIRAYYGFISVLILYLSYTSGYRTHLLLALGAWLLAIALSRGAWAVVKGAGVLSVLALLVTLAGVDLGISSAFQNSRFEQLSSGRPDESVTTRLSELNDVRYTAKTEWAQGQQLVGAGFGSSYVPHESYVANNVGPDGRVHNIHIGPGLVYFRFGLLGLLCWVVLMAATVKVVRRLRAEGGAPDREICLLAAIGLFVYLGESLTLNAFVQPEFGWCVGVLCAVIFIHRQPKNERAKARKAKQSRRRPAPRRQQALSRP